MITLEDYWMRRDTQYPDDFTTIIQMNGARTVAAINPLLQDYFNETGIELAEVASGWRPAAVNDATSNAADHSNHIIALACDIRDATGAFPRWCSHQAGAGGLLEQRGLWMENWHWTPTWAHLQPVPPHSGKREYIPSSAPPPIPLNVSA